MLFLLCSDLHGSDAGALLLKKAADRHSPDCLILLGDILHGHSGDKELFLSLLSGLSVPVLAVKGNCDYLSDEQRLGFPLPDSLCFPLFGRKCHFSHYPPSGRLDGGLYFHGHTHVKALFELDGSIICCPGSISYPRDGLYSYALLSDGLISLYDAENGQKIGEKAF